MRIFAADLERSAKSGTGFEFDRRSETLNRRMISPNRSQPRLKPEGMLWRIMRWFRDHDMRLGFAAIALL
jgi:hypothetical protein